MTTTNKLLRSRLLSVSLLSYLLAACMEAEPPPAATIPAQQPAPAAVVQPSEPLAPDRAHPPVQLTIPALNLTVPITPMAWQAVMQAGQRRAEWVVPADTAGWHINSAGAGAQGNVVISGHHQVGAAVFSPLARDQVQVGQQLWLTDDQGNTYVYQVATVTAPLPAQAATASEQDQATRYLAPTATAQLTLVTGWPATADTHYRFVIGTLIGYHDEFAQK